MSCWGAIESNKDDKPNGVCSECGAETIDGESVDQCSYSPELCEQCHWAPCDQSC